MGMGMVVLDFTMPFSKIVAVKAGTRTGSGY